MSDWELITSALEATGCPSEDFGRFTNGRHPGVIEPSEFDYERSVPVLLACLPMLHDAKAKEAVVRSLSTGYAKPAAAEALLEEFAATSDADEPSLKWAIGNALDTVTDSSHRSELVALAINAEHGRGRQMIVSRLGYLGHDDDTVRALTALIEDEDVSLHAMGALRQQVGNTAARDLIEPLLGSPSTQIRRQAKDQLRRIDRTMANGEPPRANPD